MIAGLSSDFDFKVVTRDRDLGDLKPYHCAQAEAWQRVGQAEVLYVSPVRATLFGMMKILRNVEFDVLYLNSFFDTVFTTRVLLACFFVGVKRNIIVLAPRGEFSEGAMGLKRTRKTLYTAVCKWLYRDIVYHASSPLEADDIHAVLDVPYDRIRVAMDLAGSLGASVDAEIGAEGDPLRVIFLSRISPMKNLDFALRVLRDVKARVCFDIYGPREDLEYWRECERFMSLLPDNIAANYCGEVLPDQVAQTFARYELFLFPTKGENYGHVIAESLASGTPVLLSDQTPWSGLEADGLGWNFPLARPKDFASAIERFTQTPVAIRHERRERIRESAKSRLFDERVIDDNRRLFLSVV
tara:strand:- start:36733 stop:37800 length:1068 start_codon:yes stop_codon:yes gene_type:complete